MLAQLLHIAVPATALVGVSAFFLLLAKQAATADKERQRKARRLTRTARDAVLGSVGWTHGDGLASDFDCGMVSKEVGGKIVVARQARLTQETVSSL
jgi:hypothetical protein